MRKVQGVYSEFVLNRSYFTGQLVSHKFSYWMSHSETYDIFLLVTVSPPVAMIERIIIYESVTADVLFLYLFSNYFRFLLFKVTCFPTLHSGFNCVINDEGNTSYNTYI